MTAAERGSRASEAARRDGARALSPWARLALAAVTGALALALRLPDLDVFLTADESRWACRSSNFWHALEDGRLADTYQKEHPGVVTMWLGGVGLPRDAASDWATACRDIDPSKLVEQAPRSAVDGVVRRLYLGRARIAAATSLGAAAMTWFAAGLLGPLPAALGGVLIAADPFLVAHARVLHLDGVTTTLMMLSLLALLAFLHGGRRARFLVLAGALGGLAAVNKSPALFVAPMAGLLLLVDAARRELERRPATSAEAARAAGRIAAGVVRALLPFGLAAAAAYVAVWPAMWVGPAATVGRVLEGAQEYADFGHEGGNYFLGLPVADPGPLFYPVAWAMRTTPAVLLGLALAAALARRPAPSGAGSIGAGDAPEPVATRRAVLASLLAYAAIFGVGMTLGAKKFDRYLLPAFPAVDLVAGWGLAAGLGALAARAGGAPRRGEGPGGEAAAPEAGRIRRRAVAGIGAALVALGATAGSVRHAPYYLDAFNPLLGGLARAPGRLLVGWGEGLDQSAAWLDALPGAADLQVATRYRSAFGPLFHGHALEMNKIEPATVDYYLFYQNQLQRDLDPELLARYRPGPYGPGATGYAPGHPASTVAALPGPAPTPAHVVRIGGLEYAWLYESDTWRPVADIVQDRGRPGEAIVVRGDARFAERYDGPLPLIALDPDADDGAVRRRIRDALSEHDALWWVRYDELVPRRAVGLVDALLATSALRVDRAALPEVTLTRYVGGEEAAALAVAPPPPMRPITATFGDALELRGWGQSADPAVWGRGLGIRLGWRLAGETERTLTAFLHLLSPDGRRVAQVDRGVRDEALRATSGWPAGATAVDERVLDLPVGAPPGDYTLLVGIYDADTGERLPAHGADGERLADDVLPIPIAVARSPLGPEEAARALGVEPAGALDAVRLLAVEPLGPVDGGATVTLAVTWAVDETPEGNHRVDVTVRDALGQTAGLAEVDTVFGVPEDAWRPGDVLRTHYDLLLDPRAAAGKGSIAFRDASGREATLPLEIDGPLRRDSLPADAGEASSWRFGEVAALRAVRPPARAAAGDPLVLALWWEALSEPQTSYSVFVHLVGEDGAIAAQSDAPPAGGARPTTSWLAREILEDVRVLDLPADLPPGDYDVLVGLYDPATGARLPATDAGGARAPDDRAPVATVRVR